MARPEFAYIDDLWIEGPMRPTIVKQISLCAYS